MGRWLHALAGLVIVLENPGAGLVMILSGRVQIKQLEPITSLLYHQAAHEGSDFREGARKSKCITRQFVAMTLGNNTNNTGQNK